MSTKRKTGKGRVPSKIPKNKKVAPTYAVKPHRYSITLATGSKPFYETPELLADQINEYFEYIKGEFIIQELKVKNAKTGKTKTIKNQICVRDPEPATITGLTLFLGFSHLEALTDYEKKGPAFAEIVKRAKLRVANRYERNLSGTTPTGSIFALKNMGWKDSNLLGEGDEGTGGIIAWKYIIPPKPTTEDE